MTGPFEALADPVRRRVLELLALGDRSAGEIAAMTAETFQISQPATSQHLAVLRSAGLVTVRSEGTRRIYAADPERLAMAAAWFDRFRSTTVEQFAQPLDALATELVRGRRDLRRRGAEPGHAGSAPPDPQIAEVEAEGGPGRRHRAG